MSYRRSCWNCVSLLARSNAISLLRVMLMSKEKAKKEPQKTLKEKRKEKKEKKVEAEKVFPTYRSCNGGGIATFLLR